MMIFNKVSSPNNESDFKNYYMFRWEYLRKDLDQEIGTEKDDIEHQSIHRMIKNDNDIIIGVGRLHKVSLDTSQIRYFAIHKDYRRIGLGRYLMSDLEKIAINKKTNHIVLNARENSIFFYKNLGYQIVKKTNLLYGKIQHYKMKKTI